MGLTMLNSTIAGLLTSARGAAPVWQFGIDPRSTADKRSVAVFHVKPSVELIGRAYDLGVSGVSRETAGKHIAGPSRCFT